MFRVRYLAAAVSLSLAQIAGAQPPTSPAPAAADTGVAPNANMPPAVLPAQGPATAPAAALPAVSMPPAAPMSIQPYWRLVEPHSVWEDRTWVSNEVLVWWVKNGPQPVPLISSSNAADVGTIGAPSTQILYGGNSIDYGTVPGYRLDFGTWFCPDKRWGVQSRWLFLGQTSTFASAVSDPAGNPTFAIPIFDPRPSGSLLFGDQPAGFPLPGEAGLFITQAGNFSGGIVISNSTELWGTEINGLRNLVRNQTWNLNFLGGFRYLNLEENLLVQTSSLGLAGAGTFAGALFQTRDRFNTDNDFYGGQFGLQAGWQCDRFTANLNGQVALGGTYQRVIRRGGTAISNSLDPVLTNGVYTGGLLVVPTNSGTVSNKSAFAIVPELQFQVGYNICRCLRFFVGYSFLYCSNVVRPGDQIDRVVNPTQVPAFGGLGLIGPARPAAILQQTDFWAQGVNFGLALQF